MNYNTKRVAEIICILWVIIVVGLLLLWNADANKITTLVTTTYVTSNTMTNYTYTGLGNVENYVGGFFVIVGFIIVFFLTMSRHADIETDKQSRT
jgi:hypothetical protein